MKKKKINLVSDNEIFDQSEKTLLANYLALLICLTYFIFNLDL